MTRGRTLVAGVAAVVVGTLLLFVTLPASSLVEAAKYEADASAGDLETPITPRLSDFYEVGSEQVGPPGQLMRSEEVAGAPDGIRLYRIVYASTDLRGNAIPVSGLFAVPAGPAPEGGFPLVGFAHGTTGVGRMCGISHTPLQRRTPGYSAWVPHIEPLVREGWAVVASDYSGMGAPGPASYLVGPLEARGILDSLRAVVKSAPETGSVRIDASKLGIYGKSQGGEAALSAMQLAPEYAPDLDIAGGVSLAPGFTPALQGILNTVARNPTSTSQNMFVLLIAKSYAENYPELVSLDEILSEEGKKRIGLLDRHCGNDLADRVSDVPLSQLIESPVASGLVTALAEGMPGNAPLAMPAVVVQGLEDTTILPQFTHAYVMAECAWGSTMFYVRYSDDDHPSINYQARLHHPSVVDWMEARWNGEPAPSNCANELLGTARMVSGVAQ